MITNRAGGRPKKGISRKAAARHRVAHTARYATKEKVIFDSDGVAMRFTNMPTNDVEECIAFMENWKLLRPGITDPVMHIIFSPEMGDRELSASEWQKAIGIFREERGLKDAPFLAQVEEIRDGHRHAQHLHLMYLRITSNGEEVPDGWDSTVHRRVSRRIERELGLRENAGASESEKYNGRNRFENRDRAAERAGIPADRAHVDPAIVQRCIDQSVSPAQLRLRLREAGVECRMRQRDGGIYAWSLRNSDGPKEWTSGSKLTPGNEFGWQKVADQLAANKASSTQKINQPGARIRTFAPRPGHAARIPLGSGGAPLKPRSLDQSVEAAMAESLDILKALLSQVGTPDARAFLEERWRRVNDFGVADDAAEAAARAALDELDKSAPLDLLREASAAAQSQIDAMRGEADRLARAANREDDELREANPSAWAMKMDGPDKVDELREQAVQLEVAVHGLPEAIASREAAAKAQAEAKARADQATQQARRIQEQQCQARQRAQQRQH